MRWASEPSGIRTGFYLSHMRTLLATIAIMLLSACAKEEPAPVVVSFNSICGSCMVTWGITGVSSQQDSIGGANNVYTREVTASVGDEVFITATPFISTTTATFVWLKVSGFQQDLAYAKFDTTVTLRMLVPELDRYGVKH